MEVTDYEYLVRNGIDFVSFETGEACWLRLKVLLERRSASLQRLAGKLNFPQEVIPRMKNPVPENLTEKDLESS